MESKALALGKQVKAKALNSNVHLLSVTLHSKTLCVQQRVAKLQSFPNIWER